MAAVRSSLSSLTAVEKSLGCLTVSAAKQKLDYEPASETLPGRWRPPLNVANIAPHSGPTDLSSGAGLQHRTAEPVAGEEREFHVQPALPEGTASKLLRLLHAVLGRVPVKKELVGGRGVAAAGQEEYSRGLPKPRVALGVDCQRAERLAHPLAGGIDVLAHHRHGGDVDEVRHLDGSRPGGQRDRLGAEGLTMRPAKPVEA